MDKTRSPSAISPSGAFADSSSMVQPTLPTQGGHPVALRPARHDGQHSRHPNDFAQLKKGGRRG